MIIGNTATEDADNKTILWLREILYFEHATDSDDPDQIVRLDPAVIIKFLDFVSKASNFDLENNEPEADF